VRTERMVQADRMRTNPLEAFLGRLTVTDVHTREEEDAFEYVCRHTLLRPRDLMTIGERLTALRPDERRNEYRLKEAINQAATEIAHEYLAEIAPYVSGLKPELLFDRLPGHVISRAELELIGADDETHDGQEAFTSLYRVGLLGYVQHDRVRGEWRQRFLRPGEATLETNGVLPRATHYLVHPVLFDVIARNNTAFLQRIDRVNIVGYDRPWRESGPVERTLDLRQCCVLKADVQGFGALMRSGLDGPVRAVFEEAAKRWAPPAAIVEIRAGDAALIAADDPVALAQTARHLMDAVYQAPGHPRLRIALHYGPVQTDRRGANQRTVIVGGDAILCAARVEPLVEPGQIWATEDFRQQFLERPSLWRTTAVQAPDGGDRFNIKKPGSPEPDTWMCLYRLES